MPAAIRDGAGQLLRRVGFPHPPQAWRLLRAAFFVWLALRLILAGSLYLNNGRAWTPPHWRAAALLVAFPIVVVLVEMRVMREGLLYRDLGGNAAWVVALALVGAGLPEATADALLRAYCGCA